MPEQEADAVLMRRCLALARHGLGWTSPNPLVGCVIVRGGKVIAEGAHLVSGGLHAERAALHALSNEADRSAGRVTPGCAKGATLFVNLEPCSHEGRQPPCVEAIVAAGVAKVVWGADDADPRSAGRARGLFEAAGIEVVSGVLTDECRRLNEPFYHWHRQSERRRRAFVALKAAVSSDDKIAGPGGAPMQITGPEAQAFAHELRQTYDAILIGAGTLRTDNPMLTVRPEVLAAGGIEIARPRDPVAIVVTKTGEIPPDAKLFGVMRACRALDSGAGDLSVMAAAPEGAPLPALPRHVTILTIRRAPAGGIDWLALFEKLPEFGIHSVLVEGGAAVWVELIDVGICDVSYTFCSGKNIGPGISAPMQLNGLCHSSDSNTAMVEKKRMGSDSLVIRRNQI